MRRLLNFKERLADTSVGASNDGLVQLAQAARLQFEDALDHDLNTPAALAAAFEFVREINAALDSQNSATAEQLTLLKATLADFDRVLGVLELGRAHDASLDEDLVRRVEDQIAARLAARGRRDFATADRIRSELAAAGIIIEDTRAAPVGACLNHPGNAANFRPGADVAQLAEQLICNQQVVGSSPTVSFQTLVFDCAGVAQLARASAFQAECRGFESHRPLST